MKRKITCILVMVLMLIMLYTMPALATTGTVNTETLNLRKEASTNSEVLTLLNEGTKVEIVLEEEGWYKVTYKDYTGYVSKDYIKISETASSTSSNTTATTLQENPEEQTTSTTENNIVKKDISVRLIPSITSNVIENIQAETPVDIIAKTNNWAFIGYRNITGWIPLVVLEEKTNIENVPEEKEEENQEETTTEEEKEVEEKQEEKADQAEETISETIYEKSVVKYVNSSSINVRSKPTTDSEALTGLTKNTDVKVVGESGNWYKIKYEDINGYIRKDLLSDEKQEVTSRGNVDRQEEKKKEKQEKATTVEASSNSSLGEQIVAYAKQYLGCPYVYGGSGPNSFDCSGFTMYVYKHFGYDFRHGAIAQSKLGTYVAKEDLQPGDLVFFLEYQTMDEIGHVGIYIGNGEFIHASSGSGYCVKISTLESGSYLKRYDTARRII